MGDAARAECHASSDARTATGERCGDRGEVAESAGLGMKTALQIEDGFAGGATLRRRRARERQCEELLRMRRDAA